jgi:5-methylcytosine-specific restriction protein A
MGRKVFRPAGVGVRSRVGLPRRGTAAQRGYGGTWRKRRLGVLERDHYQCQRCGVPVGRSGHVDHIVSLAEGGDDSDENLQTLCAGCHSRKTAREDGGFGHGRREHRQPP